MSGDTGDLVAVLEMSDDANEDHWAQTSWHAEVAVVEAARNAGYPREHITISWTSSQTIVANTPDGRRFAAVISTRPGGPRVGASGKPSERDLDAWIGRVTQEAQPPAPPPLWETVGDRLRQLEGEIFRTKRGIKFTYKWLPAPYFVLRVSRNGRLIDRYAVSRALARWPVAGPGELDGVADENTYVFGLVRDRRIRGE